MTKLLPEPQTATYYSPNLTLSELYWFFRLRERATGEIPDAYIRGTLETYRTASVVHFCNTGKFLDE